MSKLFQKINVRTLFYVSLDEENFKNNTFKDLLLKINVLIPKNIHDLTITKVIKQNK